MNIDHALEAERIYRTLFKEPLPEFLRRKYMSLAPRLEKNHSPESVRTTHVLIQKKRDLEALEMAARHTGRYPLLSEKFRAMIYIAETIPENYRHFFLQKGSVLKGYMDLSISVIQSIYKFFKGLIIIWTG